jgi:hypothetical protein
MTARAKQRAADLKPVIDEIRRAGVVSFSGIAIKLNERSIPTARGEGWSATQVMRVMQRLAA